MEVVQPMPHAGAAGQELQGGRDGLFNLASQSHWLSESAHLWHLSLRAQVVVFSMNENLSSHKLPACFLICSKRTGHNVLWQKSCFIHPRYHLSQLSHPGQSFQERQNRTQVLINLLRGTHLWMYSYFLTVILMWLLRNKDWIDLNVDDVDGHILVMNMGKLIWSLSLFSCNIGNPRGWLKCPRWN